MKVDIPSKREVKRLTKDSCEKWFSNAQKEINRHLEKMWRRIIDLERILEIQTSKVQTKHSNR